MIARKKVEVCPDVELVFVGVNSIHKFIIIPNTGGNNVHVKKYLVLYR